MLNNTELLKTAGYINGQWLGPVTEIKAPTQVSGPYEVSLEEWVTLAQGMQINVRKDGKYSMFEFDQDADGGLDFVKWNKEQDAK